MAKMTQKLRDSATELNPEIISQITLTLAEVRNRVSAMSVQSNRDPLVTQKPAGIKSNRHMRMTDLKVTKIATVVIALVAALLTTQIVVSQYQIHCLQEKVTELEAQIKKQAD